MPKKPIASNLEYVLLGLLNHEPMSGYDLKKRIELEIGFYWREVSYGQIYPTLKSLLKENSIVLLVESKEGNRPAKKIYTITKKGKQKLIQWISKPIEYSNYGFSVFQELLLRLNFSSIVSKEITLKHLESFNNWIEEITTLFKGYDQNLMDHLDNSKDHPYFLSVLRFGSTVYKSLEDWIKETIEFLG